MLKCRCAIVAAVILPTHVHFVHFIWALPRNDSNYSKRVGLPERISNIAKSAFGFFPYCFIDWGIRVENRGSGWCASYSELPMLGQGVQQFPEISEIFIDIDLTVMRIMIRYHS